MIQDFTHAFRRLIKTPAYSGATILILALGIGGVTAMFSVLDSVMIRPLPYPEPERLVLGRATYSGRINGILSGPDYIDFRDQAQSFAGLEAFYGSPFDVTARKGETTERAQCLLISTGFFQTLGVRFGLGRSFGPEDGSAKAPPVAIISHSYWRRRFASSSEAIGATIRIDGNALTVVGVAPQDFHFIHEPDVWLPQRPGNLGPRRYNNWLIVGRLKPGVPLSQAQSEVDVLSAGMAKAYPDTNAEKALLLTPLQNSFTDQYRTSFGLLLCGTAALLLIACANAAGLCLTRNLGRTEELAVRIALGASPSRIVGVLLSEACLLAVAGGAAGVVFAVWFKVGLVRLLDIDALFLGDTGLSFPVLGFVALITVLVVIGFGLLPAWRARNPEVVGQLKTGVRVARSGARLRRILVGGQIGVSFGLLIVCGLLTRSVLSLQRTDVGFDRRNLLTFEVPVSPRDYDNAKRTAFFESLLQNIRAMPGVLSAAAASQLPIRDPWNNVSISETGASPRSEAETPTGNQRVVSPGYFATMGIPLVAGRDIRASDSAGASRVVVISQSLARQIFQDRDPLGRSVVIDGVRETPWEVVGVVGEVKANILREDRGGRGSFYRPHAQVPLATMRVAIRTKGDAYAVLPAVTATLQKMDARVPLAGVRSMQAVIDNATSAERAVALCLTTFCALALILAAIGIYGLLAYSVSQRRREIGIRLALGSSLRSIVWSVVSDAGLPTVAGVLCGGIGALAATRLIGATLYETRTYDPFVFIASGTLLLLVAGLASWLPARRAARVDPAEALRAE